MTGQRPGVQRFRNSKALHVIAVAGFFVLLYSLFFSPVLLSGRLLAPNDALSLYLPSFLSPFSLWEPNLQGGTPAAADLQTASWYPVARLFAVFGFWNAFVISAYVLLSCFTYAYIYFLTKSWLGALISGIASGMSGFMMAHLGHTIVIHGMAWIPLILLAIEKLRTDVAPQWLAAGAVAIAFSLLSGHPQVPAYGMLVAALYAVMLLLIQTSHRIRFLASGLLMVLIGAGLTAVQIVPLFELVSQSIREQPTFRFFISHSLPATNLVGLLFPALFGTVERSLYSYPYFGPPNQIEMAGYTGVITMLLSFVGIQRHRERHQVWFWTGIMIVAGLLTLGKAMPLTRWLFLIPGINSFRVPARHFSEMTLAVSFLAGFGAAALHQGRATRQTIFAAAAVGGMMFLAAGAVIRLRWSDIAKLAEDHGIIGLSPAPWVNPATAIPVALFFVATGALFLYAGKQSPLRTAILIAVLAVDLASFGFFCDWRMSPGKEVVYMPASLQPFQEQLKMTRQRILPTLGVRSLPEEGAPNLTRLWNIPNASGYGSLLLKRTSEMLSMPTEGTVQGDWAAPGNTGLDLMAVRYVVWRSGSPIGPEKKLSEFPWSQDNLEIRVGSMCESVPSRFARVRLPLAFETSSLALMASLSCTDTLPKGQLLASLELESKEGEREVVQIQTGDDTAGVTLPLQKTIPVRNLDIHWVGPGGSLSIHKMTLIGKKRGEYLPLSGNVTFLGQVGRWHLARGFGEFAVFENRRAMPRGWLVPTVKREASENILQAVLHSRLPGGLEYRPEEMALVEETFALAERKDPQATVQIIELKDTSVEVEVTTSRPAFLVLSDVYYPGWNATVNGKPAHLYRTDYVLRGLPVGPGLSKIRMEYKPESYRTGLAISTASLLALAWLIVMAARCRRSVAGTSVSH